MPFKLKGQNLKLEESFLEIEDTTTKKLKRNYSYVLILFASCIIQNCGMKQINI